MKLSIFTTITRPEQRGDNWLDALLCYRQLADELVIVDGGTNHIARMRYAEFAEKIVIREWTQEFNWSFIGQQFQYGYAHCTGDWVIHADLDFLFHEKDFAKIRRACMENPDAPALTFYKHQFILPDRYNLKSRLVICVNKRKYGNHIRFDSGGDLCQPSLDGVEITPDSVPESKVAFYNYEKILKTKEQITNDVGRMARAWDQHFHDKRLGYDDDEAYQEWFHMSEGRFAKPQQAIALSDHPKFIQETIRRLKPNQWGYSGFGQLGKNNYVEEEE